MSKVATATTNQQIRNFSVIQEFQNFIVDGIPGLSPDTPLFESWDELNLKNKSQYVGPALAFTESGHEFVVHQFKKSYHNYTDVQNVDVNFDCPTIMVVRENSGVNFNYDPILPFCDFLANLGWRVVLPEFHDGDANTPEERAILDKQLTEEKLSDYMTGALRFCRDKGTKLTDFEAAVGVISIGGRGMALRSASDLHGHAVHAAVGVGDGIPQGFDPATLKLPVQLHYGLKDTMITKEQVDAFETQLDGNECDYEIWRYDNSTANFLHFDNPEVPDLMQLRVVNRMREFFLHTLNDSNMMRFTSNVDDPKGHIYVPFPDEQGRMMDRFDPESFVKNQNSFGVRVNQGPHPGLPGGNLGPSKIQDPHAIGKL